MYKGEGGWGGWAAGGRLHFTIGLFAVATSPRNPGHTVGPVKLRGPKRCLTNVGVNARPMPPIYIRSALRGHIV